MMDPKNFQNKESTLLKRQKLLLNEKLIFTHYFNRVYDEEIKKDPNFEVYFNERKSNLNKITPFRTSKCPYKMGNI